MRLAILTGVVLFCADAAWGQLPDVRTPVTEACREPWQASKAFVDNLKAAQAAFGAKDWHGFLGGAALARPHAASGQQASAVIQIEIAAYHELRNQPAMVERLKLAIADACVPLAIRKNYQQMMDKIDAGGTAWPQEQ